MKIVKTVFLSLTVGMTLVACGGGGGGNSNPSSDDQFIKIENPSSVSGNWNLTTKAVADSCGEFAESEFEAEIEISDDDISLEFAGESITGSIKDGKIVFNNISYAFEGGTSTSDQLVLTFDKDGKLSGTLDWQWTDGTDSCSGSDEISLVKTTASTSEIKASGNCSADVSLSGNDTAIFGQEFNTGSSNCTDINTNASAEFTWNDFSFSTGQIIVKIDKSDASIERITLSWTTSSNNKYTYFLSCVNGDDCSGLTLDANNHKLILDNLVMPPSTFSSSSATANIVLIGELVY